jgi:hypothetical protein
MRSRGNAMPRTSHQKCERCHVRQAHKRARYSMCPPCRAEYRVELREQRARARAVDPVAEAVKDVVLDLDNKPITQVLAEWHNLNVALAGDVMPRVRPEVILRKVDPTTVNRVSQVNGLTDEQRLEIGHLYEDGISYDSIRQRLKVSNATIVRVARDLGLPPRNKGPRSVAQEQPVPQSSDSVQGRIEQLADNPAIPAEHRRGIEQALERMVLPPKPEPVLHSTRLPVSDVDAVHWEVRVEGILDAYYPTIEEALASVRRLQPGLRITGIVQAQ